MKNCRPCFGVVLIFATALTLQPLTAQPQESTSATAQESTKNDSSGTNSVPKVVRFSGTLRNLDGEVRTGVTSVSFSIYKEQSGGAPLWIETQNVTVDDSGTFRVLLGATRADGMPMDVFSSNEARWLSVSSEKIEQSPRSLLVSVPYALKAGDADTLGGRPLSDFVLMKETGKDSSGQSLRLQSQAAPNAETSGTVSSTSNTVNKVAKFTGIDTLGDSQIFDNGTDVGIGTTSPAQKLDVNGNIIISSAPGNAGMAGFNVSGAGVIRNGINMPNLLGTGDLSRQGSFFSMDTRAGQNVLSIWTRPATIATETERVTIQSTGNVGIGNTSPSQVLDVGGNIATSGSLLLNSSPLNTGMRGFNISGDGVLRVGVNMPNLLGTGDQGKQGSFFSMDTRAGQNVLSIWTRQAASATEAERVTIQSTGNVGIGNTAPAAKLDVVSGTAPQTAKFTQTAAGIASSPSYNINTPTAIRGDATSATGVTTAVLGTTSSELGRAVVGLSLYTGSNSLRNAGVFGGAVDSQLGTGVWGEASSSTPGTLTGDAIGVYGVSSSSSGAGVFGEATAASGDAVGVAGKTVAAGGSGLLGEAIGANSGENYGVYGRVENSSNVRSVAGMFVNTGTGSILAGRISKDSAAANVFRIDTTGKGFFNGGTQTGGADFAESVSVTDSVSEYQPGDVMGIDRTGIRRFTKTNSPYSTLVAGIYSTKPGILATPHSMDDPRITENEVPLAVIGIVPCKVSNENGPIQAGDLLVSSSRAGYAMKGTDLKRMTGAVVGKALGPMTGTSGVIEVLVSLQ